MKQLELTQEELSTLIWCVQAMTAKTALKVLDKGEKPSENATIQRLHQINNKAYAAYTSKGGH